jgi:PRTRC genetic system protein C
MANLKAEAMLREFSYNGVRIPDPAPQMSVEQVREMLTPTFPEIATASLTGPEDTGTVTLVDHSSVVDEDVELTVLCADSFCGLRNGFRSGDIQFNKARVSSFCFQLRFSSFPQLPITGANEYGNAFLAELTCHFKPNPLVRAGNQGNLAFVFLRHAV